MIHYGFSYRCLCKNLGSNSHERHEHKGSVVGQQKEQAEYEQDFSGFVLAIGTAAAKKAACLKEGERIKLGDVDVTTKYDKEKKVTYTNFKMFSFEVEGDESSSQTTDPQPTVDDDSRLPF